MWNKVESALDIPIGQWLVYMSDGTYGFCEVQNAFNSKIAFINGSFYFDTEPVLAYTSFIKYTEV